MSNNVKQKQNEEEKKLGLIVFGAPAKSFAASSETIFICSFSFVVAKIFSSSYPSEFCLWNLVFIMASVRLLSFSHFFYMYIRFWYL